MCCFFSCLGGKAPGLETSVTQRMHGKRMWQKNPIRNISQSQHIFCLWHWDISASLEGKSLAPWIYVSNWYINVFIYKRHEGVKKNLHPDLKGI